MALAANAFANDSARGSSALRGAGETGKQLELPVHKSERSTPAHSNALHSAGAAHSAAANPLSLQPLSQLIANATEAYTAALFRADREAQTLSLVAAQTLSRDLILSATIAYGQGLVGWVAENETRLAACPFEHDAMTLMYYSKDQDLKSFIALPIFSGTGELAGVLACDSKRSYAFSKVAEKVLLDCAGLAGQFFDLQNSKRPNAEVPRSLLESSLETLRNQQDERALLSAASDLPEDLIARDALVVLCLSDNGTGDGLFYSKAAQSHSNNRLLELVCRHKRLISRERSVQTVQGDELGRSFLSVPFRVLSREAGSLNLLSRSGENFSLEQVASLEKIAQVIGHELERLRLSSLFTRQTSLTDFKSFELRANLALKEKRPLALLRFVPFSLYQIESQFGGAVAISSVQRFGRLLEQVRGTEGLLCSIHGSHFLLLCAAEERDRLIRRVHSLFAREDGVMGELPKDLRKIFADGLRVFGAISGSGASTLDSLSKKTLESALADAAPAGSVQEGASVWQW